MNRARERIELAFVFSVTPSFSNLKLMAMIKGKSCKVYCVGALTLDGER